MPLAHSSGRKCDVNTEDLHLCWEAQCRWYILLAGSATLMRKIDIVMKKLYTVCLSSDRKCDVDKEDVYRCAQALCRLYMFLADSVTLIRMTDIDVKKLYAVGTFFW